MGGLATTKRTIALYDRLLLDTTGDDYLMALDAVTGEMVWETQVLDYTVNPALQTAGPIVAGGRVVSGRSCRANATPDACVVTAHDALTGRELWRRRTIPGPGEPGDETWGDVPFERRKHVGTWMVPSYDPGLNLVYIGTSVTSPAPKFMLGGPELAHLYHNSTLALDADTGDIVWYYQHLNDDWDLDHPFERLLVDTAVAPDPDAVAWINPRLRPGEERRVMTGIPGKTGVVYTLDRETGEFLWANPTVAQNVITHIDGATGDVNGEPRGHLLGPGPGAAGVPELGRRQRLGGGRLQPPHPHHVLPACATPASGCSRRPRAAARPTCSRPATSSPPAPTGSAPSAPSPSTPAPPAGCTSSAPPPCRSSPPAAGSSSAATPTAGSAPSTRTPARCCGRSTSARRSAATPSRSRSTAGSTWRSATGTSANASINLRMTPELRPSFGNNLFVFALP